ncbi:MAG TPA: metallophosphoesterase family protein [Thermomicrobiales bacterium]|jgi:diadenosine tetraphosphatase ApaH/serine/threonine PP2A family protein phosphatase|nr:metallophosphoesterase family protein [Thermomicrobiales bacterium]
MRAAILSDIHGNRPALEAVLADASGCDVIWNLGDTVGYGPDPVGCMDRMAGVDPEYAIVGNHDLACIGELDVSQFNLVARLATEWTLSRLDDAHRDAIRALPQKLVSNDVTLVHGSPRSPIWEYILSEETSAANFPHLTTSVCFVGHTHVAASARATGSGGRVQFARTRAGQILDVAEDRWIINVGSVGQPRDGDPRASYVVLDNDQGTVEVRRVPYPIAEIQDAIVAAGLPDVLATRLALGR